MKSSITTSKIVSAVVGLGLAASMLLGVSANVASAQSMTLAQLVNLFISLGIIPADKAAAAQAAISGSTSASSYTFNTDLTVGSTGADVTALQNAVGVSPATGYFGAITKAAVMKWQASAGLPSTGYFGPLSRAKLNASSMTTTTTTTTTTGTTATTVTNTGVEGILTSNLNAIPSSGQNVYAGDSMDSILGIKLQAQLSPITIQRVQLDLGNSSNYYTKFFQTLYLVDDTGKVLAQAALNSNTVTKQTSGSTNTYLLTFSGFNYTIPGDNSIHVLTVKGDLYGSIDSVYAGTAISTMVDANGIRGVDGAGIDQYAPSTGTITNSVTLNKALSDSAQLQLSTDAATPLAAQVVASQGSNSNELDGTTALVFDLYSQKDWTQLDSMSAGFNGTTGSGLASATTAYLFAGSQQISSAAIAYNTTGQYGTASFTNVNYKISQNTTQAFTIKTDIKNANSSSRTWFATVTAANIVAENSVGNTISSSNLTGSATGNNIVVTSAGPVFTLVGSPMITTQQTSAQNNTSTTTASATFNVQIQAVGHDVFFGTQSASTTFGFSIYQNGAASGFGTSTYGAVTSWSVPSSGVVTTGLPGASVAFDLQQNNTIQLPVTFSFQNRQTASTFIANGNYAIALDSVNWSLLGGNVIATTNFMTGQTNWRTNSVSLP